MKPVNKKEGRKYIQDIQDRKKVQIEVGGKKVCLD